MAWEFKPGMEVVFLGGETRGRWGRNIFGFRRWKSLPTDLVKGSVYTVDAVVNGHVRSTGEACVGITLIESPHPDGAYRADLFRPVRTTSIASLEAHLNTLPVNKTVEA